MSYREDLKAEATQLGIEFPSNVKDTKLQALVTEAGGTTVAPVETVEAAPVAPTPSRPLTQRDIIRKARKEAFTTHVVNITNKDNRESAETVAAFLSFENQHFGLAKRVFLDQNVELEQALIDVAESTTMTLPRPEIIDGKRTGNHIPVTVKKYAVSYVKGK